MNIKVESDLPMTELTFSPKLKVFEIEGPASDGILIRHHFGLPDLAHIEMGEKVLENMYLTIFRKTDGWIYVSKTYDSESNPLCQVSFADRSHSVIEVFNDREDLFKKGDLHTLSFYHNDLLFLTQMLVHRLGCMFHSSAVILDGKGFLFVGHSGAGKSTMIKLLGEKVEILCDDRNIIRKTKDGFRVYGTWNHGEIPAISSRSAPLQAIMLLKQADTNRICIPVDKTTLLARLFACTIKPLASAEWWSQTFSLIGDLVQHVPCHTIEFDRSGEIVEILRAYWPVSR